MKTANLVPIDAELLEAAEQLTFLEGLEIFIWIHNVRVTVCPDCAEPK